MTGDDPAAALTNNNATAKANRPSLAKILLSLEGCRNKQLALSHVLQALHILHAREAIVGALVTESEVVPVKSDAGAGGFSLEAVPTGFSPVLSPEEPTPRLEGSVGTLGSMVSTLELADIGINMTDSITRASEVSNGFSSLALNSINYLVRGITYSPSF